MIETKKYCRSYIGKEFKTNQGCIALVVDGGSKNRRCTIRIGEWYSEVDVGNLKRGAVKTPYYPSVCGVGYLGEGEYMVSISGKITKSYSKWSSMIERCYDQKHLKKYPTYKGCLVSDKWHNYQIFAEWFEENYVDGWHLDKDLLKRGNKVYSENTCVFIPQDLNNFMTNNKITRTSKYIGVSYHKVTKKWTAQINDVCSNKYLCLGFYKTQIKASESYMRARFIMASKMRFKMRDTYGITDTRILDNIK